MALFIPFIFLLFSAYATAQLCEQCDTSKAAFFATDSGLSSGACGYGALALKMYGGHADAARLNIYEDGQGCGACYKGTLRLQRPEPSYPGRSLQQTPELGNQDSLPPN